MPQRKIKRAFFLDRDGTLIEEKEYLHKPEQVTIYPEAIQALKKLHHAEFSLFLVTNQSGVGRGYFTLEDVNAVHRHIENVLRHDGIVFQKIYVAPEAPDQPSRGRKPSPQFLFDARDEFGIDLGSSYMAGDKLIDLESGWNAGVKKCFLVRTGYGARVEKDSGQALKNALVADTLEEVANWILKDLENSRVR